MKVIMMKEFGPVLGTRVSGRSAYSKIMKATDSLNVPAIFDFSGVKTITSSYADEVFGRIALTIGIDAMKRCTSFRNIDRFWAKIIRDAINSRNKERETATV